MASPYLIAHHPLLVPPTRKRRRVGRTLWRITVVLISNLALLMLFWSAVHRVPWLGPAVADGLRAMWGPEPVAWLEDVAYGIQDRINRWRYRDSEPTKFWEVPEEKREAAAHPKQAGGFFPEPYAPPYKGVATPADGTWVPIVDPHEPDAPSAMFKSMVHPDPRRSFAALAVVAIDANAFELHLMPGTREPESHKVKSNDRPGVVPAEHAEALFAAFNGGFKATHGNYGMMHNGVEYLQPLDFACTFARYRDGGFRIATFSKMKTEVEKMTYYRQTPPCLVEDGEIHSVLNYHENAKNWGATVSGETVIRRSAIGLDRERKVLFYGLGEAMTAQAIARGMKAAGAHWVAELDVNHSYPRFLFYERVSNDAPPRAASAIIPGIDFEAEEYVAKPSQRDFFYLTRNSKAAALPPKGDSRTN
jgi:hypothetical protein